MEGIVHMIPVMSKASNVCTYCRVRKQKCDRSLPRCARCAAKNRACDYTPYKEPPRHEYVEPEPLVLHSETCFHADLSSRGAMELLRTIVAAKDGPLISTSLPNLSKLVYEILDFADVDMAIVLREFGPCISQWCPIIPEDLLERCKNDLENGVPRPERVNYPLLLLCLWMVTRKACADTAHVKECELYRTLKILLGLLQGRSEPELGGVQVGMLIAVYEVGHGMQRQAIQSMASCAALLRILELDARKKGVEEAVEMMEWLQASMLILDRMAPLSLTSDLIPLALRSSDPISQDAALRLAPEIPLPPIHTSATSPRRIHIRVTVSIASGYVLEYIHARQYGLQPANSYDDVDNNIANCIKLLVGKPQPHTWLHCDAIAVAFCSHLLLQQAQMVYLSALMTAFDVPGPEYSKAHMALKFSRRMAWDMLRVAFQKVESEDEIAFLPFAGLCSVLRAGIAVLETAEFMADEILEPGELDKFANILAWFSGRWTIGRDYMNRVAEMIQSNYSSTMSGYESTPGGYGSTPSDG